LKRPGGKLKSSADTWRPALENVGFAAPEIVEYLDILKLKKLHVSAFLHLDHAGAGGMGHSFSYASEVLFSPSIFSSGKGMQGQRNQEATEPSAWKAQRFDHDSVYHLVSTHGKSWRKISNCR
jgi:hypothetical protein